MNQRKEFEMKRALCLILAALLPAFAACSPKGKRPSNALNTPPPSSVNAKTVTRSPEKQIFVQGEPDENGFAKSTVYFEAEGEAAAKSPRYSAVFVLPAGWSVKKAPIEGAGNYPDTDFLRASLMFARTEEGRGYFVFDDKGDLSGMIAFGDVVSKISGTDKNSKELMELLRSSLGGLVSGDEGFSLESGDCRRVVSRGGRLVIIGRNAVDLKKLGGSSEGETVRYFPAIAACDNETMVAVLLEFCEGLFTEEQLTEIAKNFSINRER